MNIKFFLFFAIFISFSSWAYANLEERFDNNGEIIPYKFETFSDESIYQIFGDGVVNRVDETFGELFAVTSSEISYLNKKCAGNSNGVIYTYNKKYPKAKCLAITSVDRTICQNEGYTNPVACSSTTISPSEPPITSPSNPSCNFPYSSLSECMSCGFKDRCVGGKNQQISYSNGVCSYTTTSQSCSTIPTPTKSCSEQGGFKPVIPQYSPNLANVCDFVSACKQLNIKCQPISIDGRDCCIPKKVEIKTYCESDGRKYNIGKGYCDGDNPTKCLIVSGKPQWATGSDCSLGGGCNSNTLKCNDAIRSDTCLQDGKVKQLGDTIKDWYCSPDKTKRLKDTVYQISGKECIVETTEAFLCNFGCKEGVCLDEDGGKPDKTQEELKNEGLTYDEIQDSSNEELFLNSCTSKSECLSNKCLTFNSLITKDILTEQDVENILDRVEGQDYFKAITGGAFIGGGICAATGLGIIISPFCAVGGSVVGFLSATTIDAWSKKDPREIGVCIKEEKKSTETGEPFKFESLNPCSWGSKISKTNGCLVGWAIVIFGFVMLLIIFKS